MTKYYCTYFDRNYLAKSLALIESLKINEKDEFKIICLCLDESSRIVLSKLNFKETITVPLQRLEIGDFELLEAKKNRSAVEYYWTLTPTLLLRILENHPDIEMLTYLDADLYFFAS